MTTVTHIDVMVIDDDDGGRGCGLAVVKGPAAGRSSAAAGLQLHLAAVCRCAHKRRGKGCVATRHIRYVRTAPFTFQTDKQTCDKGCAVACVSTGRM